MNTIKINLLPAILVCLFLSCATAEKVSTDKKTKVSFQIGSNMGGVTENTDMNVVPGIMVPAESTVDAFSGATQPGYNAGVHLNRQLKKNQVETGFEYMYNHQTFNYIDEGNNYIGVRELHISQLMLPVNYNISLFKKQIPNAELQLKLGILGQVNFISGSETGILPDYSVIPFSAGPTFGLSFLSIHFRNGDKLGVYLDIYRGSQIYKDFYNQPEYEMPGSSFVKFGLKYQLH